MKKDTVVTKTKKDDALLVRLEPSLKQEVVRLAKLQDISAAAIMRMAARAFITTHKLNSA